MAYECPRCKLTFATVCLYVDHVKVHKSYKHKTSSMNIPCCFGCDSKFKSLESFQVHISRYHRELRRKVIDDSSHFAGVKCPCCPEQILSRATFLSHLTDHLRTDPFKSSGFPCPLCKTFVCSDVLKFRVHISRAHPVENEDFAPVSAQCTGPGVFLVSPMGSDCEDFLNRDSETESEGSPEASPFDHSETEQNLYPENLIKDQLAHYYLKLESDFILPSTQVQDIATEIRLLSEFSHHSLRTALEEELKGAGVAENVMKNIVNRTFKCDPIFNTHHKHEDVEQLSTHHLRQKYWKKNYPYVQPRQIKVGTDANGRSRFAHFVSIREGLTVLLKNEKVKELVKKSFEPKQSSDILKDFTDGTAYAEHMKQHPGGKCLQLHLFQDAFDFDAFGPTAGVFKVNGFYYTLGNLPAEYRSKLDLILMTYLLLEKDMKPSEQEEITDHDKLKEVLKPLIDELEDLKINGLEVDGEVLPVCLVVLIGDSLGQHIVGGFIRNFTSEFFCRFCPITKSDFKAAPYEVKPFRTPEQYDNSVQIIKRKWTAKRNDMLRNVGKKVKRLHDNRTALASCSAPGMRAILKKNIPKDAFKRLCALIFQGVKYRPSPFNSELLQFHVCSPALAPCLAHDLFDGIVKTILARVLKYFICKKKWFDLDTLNRRIKSFKCRRSDANDAPTIIKSLDKLGGTAVENWNLLRLLPFIIGDLIQDEEDPMWQMFLLLKEICELVCAPSIARKQVAYLKSLVKSFLLLVKKYLPDCLIPKMHFLAHYGDLIFIFGPLIRLFTLRFESKHCFFKRVGEACKCYKNITKTLSQKYIYRFAYDHSSEIVPPCLDYDSSKATPFYGDNVSEELTSVLPENLTSEDTEDLQKVTINSVNYQVGDVMILDRGDNALDLEVGLIVKILLHNQETVYFVFQQKKAINCCNRYYRLEKRATKRFTVKTLEELPDYYPLAVYEFQGHHCITLKHSAPCMV